MTTTCATTAINTDDLWVMSNGYGIGRASCGKASHWTVTFEGEQVFCGRTRREALAYIAAATA